MNIKSANDKDLENAAGGINLVEGNDKTIYKERFAGEHVEVSTFMWFTKGATVIDKKSDSSGISYYVEYEDGSKEWVNESKLEN